MTTSIDMKQYTLLALRIIMGVIFITHGAARLYYASIPNFGEFLRTKGLPIGLALAYSITILEIVSGLLLAVGFKIKYCILFHALIILGGIVLVHLQQGWFVVGHGSGGVEYSVLILAVLAVLYQQAKTK